MNYNYLNLIKLYQDNLRANNSNLGFYVALDGLSKGNMDSTLYNQFENKVPRRLDEKNPLHMLMAYQFALIDLQLFLDVNPNHNGHTLIVPKNHYQDFFDIEHLDCE